MSYPDLLAGGVTDEGTFTPTEIYAGESDVVTDRGVAGATITILQIVARDEDGTIIPWAPGGGAATIAGTFSGVGTADDTITINGVVFVLKATAASALQVTIGGTPTITATNFAAKVNANPECGVRATSAGAVVTLTAAESGPAGNAVAISESGTGFSFAGAATSLAGGSAETQTESRPVGIAAQAATVGEGIPYFSGGVFNHAALVWPAAIDTFDERRAAFDRTNLQISKLLGVSTRMTFPA